MADFLVLNYAIILDMGKSQKHLNHKTQIDLGSFYTPEHLVEIAREILRENVGELNDYTVLDSSCGYGSFLNINPKSRTIGADIDNVAIDEAKKTTKAEFVECNSLKNVSRKQFNLSLEEKLVIVGNPPYNDTTSILRHNIKDRKTTENIDQDIKTRDLGMSFLLSYDKLSADYVCVLHPLSYLIKKANFALLKNFAKNYKLVDSLVISSHEFSDTSRGTAFPIVIALYKRDKNGMDYDFIKDYRFKVKDDGTFALTDFDTIVNYVQKYPNKKYGGDKNAVAKFYTLRDINALRRNRTFIDSEYNAVYVPLEQLPYYCYIDVFKNYIDELPFYLGNCDVIIDNDEFKKIRDCFIYESVNNNPVLRGKFKFHEVENAKQKIDEYFNKLIGGEKHAKNYN